MHMLEEGLVPGLVGNPYSRDMLQEGLVLGMVGDPYT